MTETVEFAALRADWFANGNFMARAIQRQLRSPVPLLSFAGFPRHWLPMFEWAGAPWSGSIEPDVYVPLVSGRSEDEIVGEIGRARESQQLRLLVEVIASSEVVICETLQRIDSGSGAPQVPVAGEVRLTNWHGYSRPEVRAYDSVIAGFRQSRPGILFLPCAKARPYQTSQTHRRLLQKATLSGLNLDRLDIVVITSIGPVPEANWLDDLVQRYDTGIRDIYRLYLQLRALLKGTDYEVAWDLMSFAPYSELLRFAHRDGLLPEPRRLDSMRRRNIPVYREPGRSRLGA